MNEIMTEWDGVQSQNQGVIVMAATNRPFDLDNAVLRRVPRRLLGKQAEGSGLIPQTSICNAVDLPDEAAREKILAMQLKDEQLGEDVALRSIAQRTKLYSGSDLKNLSIAAAMNAVREVVISSSHGFN